MGCIKELFVRQHTHTSHHDTFYVKYIISAELMMRVVNAVLCTQHNVIHKELCYVQGSFPNVVLGWQ